MTVDARIVHSAVNVVILATTLLTAKAVPTTVDENSKTMPVRAKVRLTWIVMNPLL